MERDRTRPPCVIVLGMHRSGTSLLIGSLEAAGLNLGEVNNAATHNRRGNKENESIRSLNDELLKRCGAAWDRPPTSQIEWNAAEEGRGRSLVRPYLQAERPWGFKDPRTIWMVEGWLRLIPGARMVGVFRHPSLVVRSLIARARFARRALGPDKALKLWCEYNAELVRLQRIHGFPVIHFGSTAAARRDFDVALASFARSIGLADSPHRFFDARLVNQNVPGTVECAEAWKTYCRLIEISRQVCAREGARDESGA